MQEMMIKLIRGLLFACDTGVEISTALSEDALAGLYKLSKKHDLAHLVGSALDKQGLLPEGSEISKRFQREQLTALYRCENLKYEYKAITDVFDGEGIEYIPLKGSVIRQFYPEEWMRTSCDIDILVREEELERACAVLSDKLSYKVEGNKNYHDISLYSPSGFHLELHYNIKENTPSMDGTLSRVWDYARKCDGNRYCLTDEFLMFHLIAHTAYHFTGGGCGIRPLIDLYFLRKNLDIDSDAFASLLQESGLEKFVCCLNTLCDVWFCGGEPTDLTKEMEDYIFSGGVYGNLEQNIAVKRGKIGRGQYIKSRLFMPYESLVFLYPKLKGRRALTPIYEVKRWFKLCRRDVRSHAKRAIALSSSIDRGTIERTSTLLENLGLDYQTK